MLFLFEQEKYQFHPIVIIPPHIYICWVRNLLHRLNVWWTVPCCWYNGLYVAQTKFVPEIDICKDNGVRCISNNWLLTNVVVWQILLGYGSLFFYHDSWIMEAITWLGSRFNGHHHKTIVWNLKRYRLIRCNRGWEIVGIHNGMKHCQGHVMYCFRHLY